VRLKCRKTADETMSPRTSSLVSAFLLPWTFERLSLLLLCISASLSAASNAVSSSLNVSNKSRRGQRKGKKSRLRSYYCFYNTARSI
jgi:hypothetical protein